jgi:rubrerythrin
MSITFSGTELVNIAIGIERSGIAFYDVMSKSTKNAQAQNYFKQLAQMEQEHVKTFQAMLSDTDVSSSSATQENADYLKALVDSAVFTENKITGESAMKVSSDVEAMDMAIAAEKDSILFYQEMKGMIPQKSQATVGKIIAEEREHLSKLSQLRYKMAHVA